LGRHPGDFFGEWAVKRSHSSVPRVAKQILRFLYSRDYYLERAGDLEEAYADLADESCALWTRIWLWCQIFKIGCGILRMNILWSSIMLKNYLKTAWRILIRGKLFSLLNIAGFAFGIATYLMIGLYIQHELSYDRFQANADRIYEITVNNQAKTPNILAPTLLEEFPDVESATRLIPRDETYVRFEDRAFIEKSWVWADQHILEVFDIPLLAGNKKTAMTNPDSIIISEDMAKKYFGNKNPINDVLVCSFFGYEANFFVSGIFKNIPKNSHVRSDFFANLETLFDLKPSQNDWERQNLNTFILLNKNTDPHMFEEKFNRLLESKYTVRDAGRFSNRRLTDLHLKSTDIANHFGQVSDIKTIYFFSAIALIILLMACINYLNLSTARSAQRNREVGIRKVAGAQRYQLIMQFLGESFLFTSISILLALGISYLLLPVFNRFIETTGIFSLLKHTKSLIPLVLSVFCVGLLTGVYPAFFMSNFRPVTILKGVSPTKKRGFMRNILVVVQFSISIFLIISTIVISNQVNLLKNKKLGFAKDHIILAPAMAFHRSGTIKPVKEELLRHPQITGVAFSSASPMQINSLSGFYYQNTEYPANNRISSYYARVDYDYIDLFEIEIVKGRNFDRLLDEGQDVYIINETLAEQLEWDDPIGKRFGRNEGGGKIIGVVKDFHNTTMHSIIQPVTLHLQPYYPDLLAIKINTVEVQKTLAVIEKIYKRFSNDYPFVYNFMDERYDHLYKAEIRKGKAFSYFLCIALFICCLGLLGLTSFSVERRTKEIGIRKVFGASIPGIAALLYKEFIIWILISNAIAFPVSFYAMNKWLQNYAYRVNLGIGIFAASVLITLLIAVLTVSFQCIKAAATNPVDSLRHE
jgi:putative ABC transport system permease protein